MLKSLKIKNFRCFGDLSLKGLQRVNLIAGKNNAGKTALLEAIQLLFSGNDWSSPFKVNQFRGVDVDKHVDETTIHEICRWLFPGGDLQNVVEVTSHESVGSSRTLSIQLLDAGASFSDVPEVEEALAGRFENEFWRSGTPLLILRSRTTGGDEKLAVGVAIKHNLIWFSTSKVEPQRLAFLGSMLPAKSKDVDSFGELELNKRQNEILPALQLLEPRLQGLRLIPLAGEVVIHGDIGLNRLVPLSMMGEGTRRLTSIVLAIANTPGGTVLIDEIENGLHYSVLESVWLAIAEAAVLSDVQVFATTHSFECIQAAHRAFKSKSQSNGRHYDFAYHRLDRLNEQVVAHTFDEAMLDTVQSTDFEIR